LASFYRGLGRFTGKFYVDTHRLDFHGILVCLAEVVLDLVIGQEKVVDAE
jgi:hypothetical protein